MAAASGTAARVVEIALAEVGYLEKASNYGLDSKTANAGYNNYTKYNRDCGFGNGPIWYWCNSFVSWCAMKAGVKSSIVPKTASCAYTRDFFKARGRLHLRSSGYKPVAGDLVLFTTSGYPNGSGHIGIVHYSDNNYVYTIEGNTSSGSSVVPNGGSVCKKYYLRGKTSIYGYCHPNYTAVKVDDEMVTNVKIFNVANKKTVTVPSIVKNGENYVRLRSLALPNTFNCAVGYDPKKDLPSFDTMPLQDTKIVVNGKTYDADVLYRMGGTNFLAVRDILTGIMGIPAEAILWDDDTKTITVEGKLNYSYSAE